MTLDNQLPLGLGIDVAAMRLCLVDGPLRIAEERKFLAQLRYRSKGDMAPQVMLERLAALRELVAGFDDTQIGTIAVDWGTRFGEHGAEILLALVKFAVCDAPINQEERRFIAAVAWWYDLDEQLYVDWHRKAETGFAELIAQGATRDKLVSPDPIHRPTGAAQ